MHRKLERGCSFYLCTSWRKGLNEGGRDGVDLEAEEEGRLGTLEDQLKTNLHTRPANQLLIFLIIIIPTPLNCIFNRLCKTAFNI